MKLSTVECLVRVQHTHHQPGTGVCRIVYHVRGSGIWISSGAVNESLTARTLAREKGKEQLSSTSDTRIVGPMQNSGNHGAD